MPYLSADGIFSGFSCPDAIALFHRHDNGFAISNAAAVGYFTDTGGFPNGSITRPY